MLTRSMKLSLLHKTRVKSNYSLRPRKVSHKNEYCQPTDDELNTMSLIDQLAAVTKKPIIILNNEMKDELSKHPHKCHLVACSIPVPNNEKIEMKSKLQQDKYVPEYVVNMVLNNKDFIFCEDASIFSSEIYDCSGVLFRALDSILSKQEYYGDYIKAVTVSASDLTTKLYDGPIDGAVVSLNYGLLNQIPHQFEDVFVAKTSKDCGFESNMMDGLLYTVHHIDKQIIKEGKSIETAIQSAEAQGYRPGEIAPRQIDCIIAQGRDNKETTTVYAASVWKTEAVSLKSMLNTKNNANEKTVQAFSKQHGTLLRSYCNIIHFKPYVYKVKGPLFAPPAALYGSNGVLSKMKDSGVAIKESKFRRGGQLHTKYNGTLNESQIVAVFGMQYVKSTKSKGGHKGWTFKITKMDFSWDTQKCLLNEYVSIGAENDKGETQRAI